MPKKEYATKDDTNVIEFWMVIITFFVFLWLALITTNYIMFTISISPVIDEFENAEWDYETIYSEPCEGCGCATYDINSINMECLKKTTGCFNEDCSAGSVCCVLYKYDMKTKCTAYALRRYE